MPGMRLDELEELDEAEETVGAIGAPPSARRRVSPMVRRMVLLVALAGLAGCNTGALPPAAGYADVTGTITDAMTKAPVAGAVITIDTILTATTDASGKYTIKDVPSGIADYTVQAKGYAALSSSTNIEPGKPFELDAALTASAQPPQ
jgi:hypothetical protein